MQTFFSVHVLRAALIRRGIWLVDASGIATDFYHKMCATHETVRLVNPPVGTRSAR